MLLFSAPTIHGPGPNPSSNVLFYWSTFAPFWYRLVSDPRLHRRDLRWLSGRVVRHQYIAGTGCRKRRSWLTLARGSRCRDVCGVSPPRQPGSRGQRIPAGADLRPGTPDGLPELSDAMNHQTRRTVDKVRARLSLIDQKVYAQRTPIEPFQLRALESPAVELSTDEPVDDRFVTIEWGTPWGRPRLDFVLRSRFSVPTGWSEDGPIALHLPLGIAGDFSHPEALVYIDGEPYGSCDRHHHEILLPARWCDGNTHELTLHGWTGGTTVGSVSGRTTRHGHLLDRSDRSADQGPARIDSRRARRGRGARRRRPDPHGSAGRPR